MWKCVLRVSTFSLGSYRSNKKRFKRGDRGNCGSAEESQKKSAAKRYNMADTGEVETKNTDTSSSEQNEPNLHEIKAMLVDI